MTLEQFREVCRHSQLAGAWKDLELAAHDVIADEINRVFFDSVPKGASDRLYRYQCATTTLIVQHTKLRLDVEIPDLSIKQFVKLLLQY